MRRVKASTQSVGALVQREILRASSVESLLGVIHQHSRIIDGVNALTALNQLSRFKAGIEDKSLFRVDQRLLAITDAVSQNASRYSPRDVALAMSALAALRSCEVTEEPWLVLADALTRLIMLGATREVSIQGRDIAQALSSMATARCRHHSTFEAASHPDVIILFDARSAAGVSWAMATCRFLPSAGFLQAFSKHSLYTLGVRSFEDRELSNLAWSMAHIGFEHGAKIVEEILIEAVQRESLGFHASANIAWACAKLQVGKMDELNVLVTHAMKTITEANPQPLTLLVWALATVQLRSSDIINSVTSDLLLKISRFNAQQLGSLMWSLASMKVSHPKLLNVISEHALVGIGLPTFSDQALSSICWSVAVLKGCGKEDSHRLKEDALLEAIAREASSPERAQRLSAQQHTNFIWAFAMSSHQETHSLIDSLSGHLLSCISEDITSQNLANLSWAFATVRWMDPALVSTIASVAIPRLHKCKEKELVKLAWAFAALHASDTDILQKQDAGLTGECHSSVTLLPAIAQVLVAYHDLKKLAPRSIAYFLWAFAVCGAYPADGLFWTLLHEARRCSHPGQSEQDQLLSHVRLGALGYLVEVFNLGERRAITQREDFFDELPYLRVTESSSLEHSSEDVKTDTHEEVAKHLHALCGIDKACCNHYVCEGLRVDLALPDQHVAVNVIGESNLVRVLKYQVPDGPERFKHRLLTHLHWRVASVLECDWKALNTEEQKRSHLLQKLQEVGVLCARTGEHSEKLKRMNEVGRKKAEHAMYAPFRVAEGQ